MANKTWDDNLRYVLVAYKWPLSIVLLGVAVTLGYLDVPLFEAFVDGFAKLFATVKP